MEVVARGICGVDYMLRTVVPPSADIGLGGDRTREQWIDSPPP